MISIEHAIPTDPAGQAESYHTGPAGVEYTNTAVLVTVTDFVERL